MQQEVRAAFRKVVIALVLGTDMKQVGVLLGIDMKLVDGGDGEGRGSSGSVVRDAGDM